MFSLEFTSSVEGFLQPTKIINKPKSNNKLIFFIYSPNSFKLLFSFSNVSIIFISSSVNLVKALASVL